MYIQVCICTLHHDLFVGKLTKWSGIKRREKAKRGVQLFSSQNNMNAICGQSHFVRNDWETVSQGKIRKGISLPQDCAAAPRTVIIEPLLIHK